MGKTDFIKLGATALIFWGGFDIITAEENNLQMLMGLAKLVVGGTGFVLKPVLKRLGSKKENPRASISPAARPGDVTYQLSLPVADLINAGHLPDATQMAKKLSWILNPAWRIVQPENHGPPTQVPLIANALAAIMQSWDADRPEELDLEQTGRLFSLYRFVAGRKDEADHYSQLFVDPMPGLQLRKNAQQAEQTHDRFETEKKAYKKARRIWEEEGGISRYHDDEDLVGFLKDMPEKDVDLWHDIVCGAEPGHGPDFDAIYWITAQPECDRASIASFIIDLARLGYLETLVQWELKDGSTEFADQVGKMIQRWNAGFYTKQRFAVADRGLDHAEKKFLVARDNIADLLGREPWPIPSNLFQPLQGLETNATYSFAHNQGLYVLPPQAADYISYDRERHL